jgi:predicted transcriptional regulator of viral defense system
LFFGIGTVNAYGASVKMTNVEKTVLDCLNQPEDAGDIPEIAGMLWQGKSQINWQKLVDYSLNFKNQTLIQRLGILLELLEIQIPNMERERLLDQVKNGFCYLGRPAKWGKGGKLNRTWQVVENIQETEVNSEIRIA